MFCWQARRGFVEKLEGITGGAGSPLERHLSGCAGCCAELEGLRQLRTILSESARSSAIFTGATIVTNATDATPFEERVLRLARSRAARSQGDAAHGAYDGRRSWLVSLPGPLAALPVAAAFSLMVGAVLLSHFLGGGVPAGSPTPAAAAATSQTAAANDLDDRIVAPQEVPFVVQEDLVGARRGRIPLTTYVLEPAPDEQTADRAGAGKPVMRASL